MAAAQPSATVADAVLRIQLALLDGRVTSEAQLLAAGAILSGPDYEHVVLERTIISLCGYPLCHNPLPSPEAAPRRLGRYRIALQEHKVYDIEETYKYCSEACLVASRAFSGSLESERPGDVSLLDKVERVLRVFGLGEDGEDRGLENGEDLGFGNLSIKEKEAGKGEASMEEWLGPSDSIEGYVPQRDLCQGAKFGPKEKPMNGLDDVGMDELGFTSSIIISDEFNGAHSEMSCVPQQDISEMIAKQLEDVALGERESKTNGILSRTSKTKPYKQFNEKRRRKFESKSTTIICDQGNVVPSKNSSVVIEDLSEQFSKEFEDSLQLQKKTVSHENVLKPSLKTGSSKGRNRTVTWADEKHHVLEKKKDICSSEVMQIAYEEEKDDGKFRHASAEACAAALTRAAEAVSSGESDVVNAVSEAGIIILPQPQNDIKEETEDDEDIFELDRGYVKWPTKSVLLDTNMFEVEDSWHDTPPEGFSLTLSTFATMWMVLFGWITCSSIAYIYGHDESSHKYFLSVNGREYPRKIVLKDGKSSEIRQTIEVCIARVMPELVMDLRLSTPESTLEKAVSQLLNTMSLVDAVPAFRRKEWHLILLLFLEALSVHRLPALAQHVIHRNTILPIHKVLATAQITNEEYETMKDLLIPLGKQPQFSIQNGA